MSTEHDELPSIDSWVDGSTPTHVLVRGRVRYEDGDVIDVDLFVERDVDGTHRIALVGMCGRFAPLEAFRSRALLEVMANVALAKLAN